MSEQKKFGRYEVKQKLGEGGMGEVFLAYDTDLDREVAIKVLLAEFCSNLERVKRFKLEAKAASALNHPNIITIYEISSNNDEIYIATEYIKGQTLRQILQNDVVDFSTTLDIVRQVASSLIAAHKEGIVHRDLKPENIMIREDGIVKILDFGLAKSIQIDEDAKTREFIKTKPGMVMGSVDYMSPEQARGKEVDHRTDLWSLGIVMYEMLIGRTPFDGETTTDILANIIHQQPAPLRDFVPQIPENLEEIISKLLQKNSKNRYQSAKDFAADLKNLQREIGILDTEEFATGQFKSTAIATSPVNLSNSENAKTLIHYQNSSEELTDNKTTRQNHQTKIIKRNWVIPLSIVSLACVMAFAAWFYTPLGTDSNLDSLEILTLSNTDKAFAPTISNDGKYLGYITYENGKKSLIVRQIATSSTVNLVTQAENEGFLQPVFSPDGNYVYYVIADKGIGTLYQIPTLGGNSKKLITDIDSKITFSPNGKELAFRRRDSQTGIEAIVIANADGTNERVLITGKETETKTFTEIAWSPQGDNLLVSGVSELMIDEFVKSKLMLISVSDKKVRKFSEKDWINANSFFWTKDNLSVLILAKANEQEPAQVWQLSYPNGESLKRVTNDSSGFDLISYAREANVISASKQNIISSIWEFSPATKELNQLTTDNKTLIGATGFDILSDGRFLLSKMDSSKANIITLDSNGKDEKVLTDDNNLNVQAVMSHDGKHIVYTSNKDNGLSIWRIDADGKNPIQLTADKNFFDSKPQITADGNFVVFERRSKDFVKTDIMKISIHGGEAKPFIPEARQMLLYPKFSADGKLFVYSTMDYDKKNTRFERGVKVVNFKDNEIGELKKEFFTSFGNNYSFSPDGKNITYINQTGIPNIYNVPLDGSASKPITNFNSGHIVNFAWSNDGKKILLVRAIINSELVLMKNEQK